MKLPKPKALHPTLQLSRLRQLFPFGDGSVRGNVLVWTQVLTPSDFCRTFSVRVEYDLSRGPRVRVMSPSLEWRANERPPHLYADDSLCLYYPKAREWHDRMWLAESIIPWAAEWLLHYEIWLSTGKWCGGGIEHTPGAAASIV